MNVLGLSAFYHDAAACLVQDGRIVAAAQEERFTRIRHDAAFPRHAARYCLAAGGVAPDAIDAVVFYEKPLTHFVRLLRSYFHIAPSGLPSFLAAMPSWLRNKLWIPLQIEENLDRIGYRRPRALYFAEHHESHAASAFYPSPFASAAVLTLDGVGEWATSTVSLGQGNALTLQRELRFPHSLGLLYSAFTYFTGFKVNSGEYKLMGLAPYGEPRYTKRILDHLIDLRDDGSFRLDLRYFDYVHGLRMTNDRFARLFDGPPRKPEETITRREMDLARSIQDVTEEIVLRIARSAALSGERNVCLAGGVALNCVANGRLLREKVFDRMWIQPAAGDAGGALGAALLGWHRIAGNARDADGVHDRMEGSYLGPSFDDDEIRAFLDARGLPYRYIPDEAAWTAHIATLLAEQRVVALLMGRMEFGPRSLGHRSILGDPRSATMQSVLNLKVKFRESFRPFAPSVLDECRNEYFDLDDESPYMLLTAPVTASQRTPGDDARSDDLLAWVNRIRSRLPAVTHVDHSARVQTVSAQRSPRYHALLTAFRQRTGCGVLINTSFNVRGEPIVCTPEDAYRCFMRSEIDHLVLEHCILTRSEQPVFADGGDWKREFALD